MCSLELIGKMPETSHLGLNKNVACYSRVLYNPKTKISVVSHLLACFSMERAKRLQNNAVTPP